MIHIQGCWGGDVTLRPVRPFFLASAVFERLFERFLAFEVLLVEAEFAVRRSQ